MCACGTAGQSAFHIAVDCPFSQGDKSEEILSFLAIANSDNLVKDEISDNTAKLQLIASFCRTLPQSCSMQQADPKDQQN